MCRQNTQVFLTVLENLINYVVQVVVMRLIPWLIMYIYYIYMYILSSSGLAFPDIVSYKFCGLTYIAIASAMPIDMYPTKMRFLPLSSFRGYYIQRGLL